MILGSTSGREHVSYPCGRASMRNTAEECTHTGHTTSMAGMLEVFIGVSGWLTSMGSSRAV